ncbi:hypothetical protein Tco_0303801 [Tanacetum coccineum]
MDSKMVMLDNVMMSALTKVRTACDAIREREREKDKAYTALEGQFDKLHGKYSTLVLEEKKLVNYEQTLATLRSKVEGLEVEREAEEV